MRHRTWVGAALVVTLAAVGIGPARNRTSPAAEPSLVDAAVRRIRTSVDPCGESSVVVEVLDRFARCAARYRITVDRTVGRNLFERPSPPDTPGRVTWNPSLGGALEPPTGAAAAVERDPTASLLHELVHAVQDCAGQHPGTLEIEAVRIENVYRRAVGLPQRTGYGDVRLATAWLPAGASCVAVVPAASDVPPPVAAPPDGIAAAADTPQR